MNAELIQSIQSIKTRSAWERGVKAYALEMLDGVEVELTADNAPKTLLKGAEHWLQYSEGGCALIYDADIAERLCSPSELRKTRNGERNPNRDETWLGVQARACLQAAWMIHRHLKRIERAASLNA